MEQTWEKKISKCFLVPQRYIMGIMSSLAIFTNYTMRIAFNIVITEMVVHKNDLRAHKEGDCPVKDEDSIHTVYNTDMLYDWDEKTQGILLSAFYWGYIVTHLPGGVLAERFGGKYVLTVGLLINALVTLITPYLITSSDGNWRVVVALRVLQGLGQGTMYPSINAILGQWIPMKERASMTSLTFAGGPLGTIASNAVSGILIAETKSWTSVFYLFGSGGILWCVVWQFLCYSYPDTHRFISDKELEYIHGELSSHVTHEKKKTPWLKILTSVPLWASIAIQAGQDWGYFTVIIDLPKYMKDVLRFNVKENGLYSSLPHVLLWISAIASGYLCDWLINKGYLGITASRKIFSTIGIITSMGPASFLMIASYSGCNREMAVAMFAIAMFLMGPFYCGTKVISLDLSPNFAGTLMAISNGLGVTAGIIAPLVAGELTKDRTVTQWRAVFWTSFIIFSVTNLIFLAFGTAQEQSWNNTEEEGEERG